MGFPSLAVGVRRVACPRAGTAEGMPLVEMMRTRETAEVAAQVGGGPGCQKEVRELRDQAVGLLGFLSYIGIST